jgi:alanyl-tRNA synthetase
MTVRKLYLESDLPTGAQTAGITQIGEDEAGPFVCLTATWFHPQGGGQRADEGTIAGRRVVTVQHAADGGIQHVLDSTDGLSVGATVDIVVDANTRLRHARLHSGGHLIAAVVEAAGVGAEATDGHHWPGEARVQFAETAGAVQLNAATIQAAVDDAIAADLPFRIEGDPQTDRKIRLGDHPAVPCGGTHVRSTAQLAGLRILKTRRKGGKFRVSYGFAGD